MRPSVKSNESGMAIITALLVLMLASGLMAGMFAALIADQKSHATDRDQSMAYAAAHAGLEKLTSNLGAHEMADLLQGGGIGFTTGPRHNAETLAVLDNKLYRTALEVARQAGAPLGEDGGERVAVEPAQVPHRRGVAPVFQQVPERLGVALDGPGGAAVVAGDRLAVLVADEEELALLLALQGVRGQLSEGGADGAQRRHQDEHGHIGEASLPTTAHSPWPRFSRPRRRRASRRRAAPAPRSPPSR